MIGSRHTIARLQSTFYRDQYYRILKWLFFSIAIMFILIAVIIYLFLTQQPAGYYASTTEGKILPMPPAISV